MKKLFAILIGLLFAISAFAVDTDQTPVWTVGPKSGGSYAIYHVVVTDSNTFDVADTSVSFPGLPWDRMRNSPMRYASMGYSPRSGRTLRPAETACRSTLMSTSRKRLRRLTLGRQLPFKW